MSLLIIMSFFLLQCDNAKQTSPPPPTDSPTAEPNIDVVVTNRHHWSTAEKAILRSLWIESLGPLPPDPTNAVADHPQAIALGRRLFFDPQFSADGTVSCATCHQPELAFTDGKSVAEGLAVGTRNSMSLVGLAYSPWFFWDGHKDSLWAQALEPWEAPFEHGGTRLQYGHLLATDPSYRAAYEAIFGPLPNFADSVRFPAEASPLVEGEASEAWQTMTLADQMAATQVFVNMGKAVAAFERQIVPGPAPFDAYVSAILADDPDQATTILTDDEVAGLRLFMGNGLCIRCHNGPRFTNDEFHNTAVVTSPEAARFGAIQPLLDDPFNCLGAYSDAQASDCAELSFIRTSRTTTLGAFKTPTLRNVAITGPYMHAGQFATLAEVLRHYNQAGAQIRPPSFGHNELEVALNLSMLELAQLEAFLHTLTGPVSYPGGE